MAERVVIVGAGHAGGTAAALLRQAGWPGEVVLIGEEPIAPYQRPPLSKAWLKGEADSESLTLRPLDFYAGAAIDLRLGERVAGIERSAGGGTVVLETGGRLDYDRLIVATGARARRASLPGAELEGVLELRTAADADRLKTALRPGRRLAVVGGGYVGLEVAASAVALGCEVVVVEVQPRPLARVAHEVVSSFIHDYHRARGVSFRLATGVAAIECGEGRICGVRLSDGQILGCDLVLVGIGAVPNQELAEAAGLACDDGILVDLAARTSDPAIFAIGDCTRRPLPHYGRLFRLESVPNALEQAKQATAAICGAPSPAPEVPWFWSDQYDLKLQIAGLPFGAQQMVLRGDPSAARFAVFQLDARDRMLAVEAVNAPPEFMGGRLLIASGARVDRARLADPSTSMKQITL